MRIFKYSIFFFVLLQGTLKSQPSLEWEARYPNGEVLAMALDKFGNVYITGRGASNIVTIKYNSVGQQLWAQIYNGPSNLGDRANAIAVDDSGNVYVTGGSFNGYIGKGQDWDYVTIKYNSNGQQQWIRTYNTPPNWYDIASAIAIDENANVYVTGYYGMRTIKYDRNGNQIWSVVYNVSSEKRAYEMKYKNGYVYITGYSNANTSSYADYLTIKYNAANGTEIWARTYNGSGSSTDKSCCVAVDDTGNVFVGGSSIGVGSGYDYVTIKYNSFGSTLWERRYNDSTNSTQEMSGLAIDNLSNIIITGLNYQTIKYSSTGLLQWVNNFYVPYSEYANSIAVDKLNNVYVTGRVQYPPPIFNNIITIKYSATGQQQWFINYNSIFSDDDRGNVVIVDSLFNVLITGESRSGPTTDFITLKYNQVVGIQNLNETVRDFELFQNYPNPFNASTLIKFSLPEKTFVKMIVYDALGREISDLLKNELSSGTYQINFDASKLASGIYIYRLITEKISVSKKLILIK